MPGASKYEGAASNRGHRRFVPGVTGFASPILRPDWSFWLGISKQATVSRDQRVISAFASTTALSGAIPSKYLTQSGGKPSTSRHLAQDAATAQSSHFPFGKESERKRSYRRDDSRNRWQRTSLLPRLCLTHSLNRLRLCVASMFFWCSCGFIPRKSLGTWSEGTRW
jgi:hypothetical protein